MEYSAVEGKTNFFDAKVAEYQIGSINIESGKSAIDLPPQTPGR